MVGTVKGAIGVGGKEVEITLLTQADNLSSSDSF